MSMLANQPRGSKPKSKRGKGVPPSAFLSEFGVPVPPRIAQFFDGPELAAHEGVKAWGFEGWSSDTKMKVKWGGRAAPRLGMFHEYATDGYFEEGAQAKYLPIAAVGSETHMFVVDVTSDTLAVHFFDYESGFALWAPDFESFLAKLLRKGQRTPSEKLSKAYEQASELNEQKHYGEVIKLLEPIVSQFPKTLGGLDDTRETLGAVYNLLGIAYEKQEDIPRALEHYETGLALGADSGGLNVCDLLLDHFKDYGKLITYGEKLRENVWAWSDAYAWFHVRNYLGRAYLLVGRSTDAIRAYHQIFDYFQTEEPAKITEAVGDLRELATEHPECRATAEAILVWLAAPVHALSLPPDKLATMRTWWSALPAKVADALREAVHVESEPSDGDLVRISQLTDVKVTNAELADVAWVTMLTKVDDLNVEGNQLTDLSPLAGLVHLTRLDVSENKVTSLRPLAALVRLERLSAGENPLAGLEGLERLHQLSYLHVNEAGLTSIEPLRGLPQLEDVTIYNNAIADLSPLAESPRIKEISSFGNPVAKGLAALAKLPRLESVDAGDDTRPEDVRALRAGNPLIEIDHYEEESADEDEAEAEAKPDPELPAIRAWWAALPAAWRKRFDKLLDRDERAKPEPSDEALLELVRKDSLHVDDEPLPDLVPLARFTRADYVNVCAAGITDLTPIAALPRLRDLLARDNPLASLAPLSAAGVLEELYIERCKLGSLAGLAHCTTLRELYAEDNLVEDLSPLAGLVELRVIDLEGNPVVGVAPLAGLVHLRELRLGLARVADLSPLAGCRELRVLEVWANPNVHGVTALAELPDLVRIVSHGSLPAAEIDELRRRRPDVAID